MENNVRSGKLQKQKNFLLMLPILVVPFFTIAFWAMGGGKGKPAEDVVQKSNGLNLNLPSANIKDNGREDKLTFYEKAQQVEQKAEAAIKNDPYYQLPNQGAAHRDTNELAGMMARYPSKYTTGLNPSPEHGPGYKDPNEEKIMQRLSMIQSQIDKPQPGPSGRTTDHSEETTPISADVDRLEEMMNMMKDRQQNDPEMERLEGMLDKVMDIQHPDRVRERLKEKSLQQKKKVFSVSRFDDSRRVSRFGIKDSDDKNKRLQPSGLHSVGEPEAIEGSDNAIEAVVHEMQTLVNGSVVKLRLLDDIYIAGTLIPKDNFIYGTAALNGERLEIIINSIRYKQSVFPTQLEVHDIDGLAGVYVPGSITRDVAKQSVDNSMQGLEMASLKPNIGVQAATAGISAAKNLLSRKVRLVKVTVKAGYHVLLVDKNNQE
ncbi:conjugative transposon protein TraM [Longitalea luteola]|uniref:conjugative transposon protein TraM n=1 Tax=Longitalea luteola TaxID=2812563 RepID=UPI001A95CCC3|nr:conjugative transposon protein TraM [Longitalea luteola]